MSKSNKRQSDDVRAYRDSRQLWHDGSALTISLGCQTCPHKPECGGMQIAAAAFDCLAFCRCANPAECDNVCPRNVEHFVARNREVGGFDLGNIPPAPLVHTPDLPAVVPMIYHRSARTRAPFSRMVALSLYQLLNKRTGELRFSERTALLDHFLLSADTQIILSGADTDPLLERWWQIERPEEFIRGLSKLGVVLITAPNFSLFSDVPRHDNLFNLKRIAKSWGEIQREGVSCALHLNARTDHDWDRWTRFLLQHPEITHVSFEFATGAGSQSRISWHVTQLRRLANTVDRPLYLIVRGGMRELPKLRAAFKQVTFIDTSAFMKAQKRKRAREVNGHLKWEDAATPNGTPIDALLDKNIEVISRLAATDSSNAGLIDGQDGKSRSPQIPVASLSGSIVHS
jgi:hypothetical protein